MPSKSKKQHNFMAAIAHSPEFAKKVGVPMSVGKDFNEADKGKKFKTGGAPAGIAKQKTHHGAMQLPNAMLNKYIGHREGGIMKPVDANENPGLAKLPTEVRNKMGYMKKGGNVKHDDMKQDMPMMKKVAKQEVAAHEKRMHKMAGGGVTRADGCVSKGHTKGKMIKMNQGGMC
jgi:hypothetical protein